MSAGKPTCPFCESPEIEVVAAWGGQLITRQMRCRTCNTYFEALRDELDSRSPKAGSTPAPGPADVTSI